MKRLLMTGLAILMLSGCADLQMIRNAAMSELQSEAISVEIAAYRQTTLAPEAETTPETVVAKPQAEGLFKLAMGPKIVTASRQLKGRWER